MTGGDVHRIIAAAAEERRDIDKVAAVGGSGRFFDQWDDTRLKSLLQGGLLPSYQAGKR